MQDEEAGKPMFHEDLFQDSSLGIAHLRTPIPTQKPHPSHLITSAPNAIELYHGNSNHSILNFMRVGYSKVRVWAPFPEPLPQQQHVVAAVTQEPSKDCRKNLAMCWQLHNSTALPP